MGQTRPKVGHEIYKRKASMSWQLKDALGQATGKPEWVMLQLRLSSDEDNLTPSARRALLIAATSGSFSMPSQQFSVFRHKPGSKVLFPGRASIRFR